MREYTFLMSDSTRTPHVKAKNLRTAWKLTKIWHRNETLFRNPKLGELTSTYQTCGANDYVMSGWKDTHDKQIKEQNQCQK